MSTYVNKTVSRNSGIVLLDADLSFLLCLFSRALCFVFAEFLRIQILYARKVESMHRSG
jgi:hypothetical protein